MILTLFYLAGIILRGLLLASFEPSITPTKEIVAVKDDGLPIYSVLVALYKEANQVEALTQSLWQLDWPKHKLDIKLICEANDHEIIEAITNAKLPACFDLILVPYAHPRTKPKALNFALPLCKGEYLVLYDAEDQPSPGQLREAYLKFQSATDNLACLQAPLHIHNQNQNWLTAMFAIEYVTLFNGILPVLAKWQVPIPLGGTSNHFKIDILKSIGAWDPYNVTEDADLGIRLFREGYRSSTITLPTFEEAPPELFALGQAKNQVAKRMDANNNGSQPQPNSFFRGCWIEKRLGISLNNEFNCFICINPSILPGHIILANLELKCPDFDEL